MAKYRIMKHTWWAGGSINDWLSYYYVDRRLGPFWWRAKGGFSTVTDAENWIDGITREKNEFVKEV